MHEWARDDKTSRSVTAPAVHEEEAMSSIQATQAATQVARPTPVAPPKQVAPKQEVAETAQDERNEAVAGQGEVGEQQRQQVGSRFSATA
jgi:hypothetical protein